MRDEYIFKTSCANKDLRDFKYACNATPELPLSEIRVPIKLFLS